MGYHYSRITTMLRHRPFLWRAVRVLLRNSGIKDRITPDIALCSPFPAKRLSYSPTAQLGYVISQRRAVLLLCSQTAGHWDEPLAYSMQCALCPVSGAERIMEGYCRYSLKRAR
ncbi:MAG: hypothetical protein GPOALKHO_000372 [Sodalis sp.]|uniref:hypothetical protein n=1 Tax=Sodalis sp. (in: enterobacteria) TaxID=1898979 RepID=UPI003872C219|nr:MAG: hypothetical protein GPOALKHO_000372 [Sodalis sp.]